MKTVFSLFFFLFLFAKQDSIKPQTQRVLSAMIEMQNVGTDEAINTFINKYFHPDLLYKMKNRSEHVSFYRQIIEEFGDVQKEVFKVEVSTDRKLKVQLLKKGVSFVPDPSPEEILVVEIDLNQDQPEYLARGLGMGALICYIKR